MTTHDDPRTELEELTARYRHLREEHRRAPAGGSVRRGLEGDMRDALAHAERRIDAIVEDPADRDGWRDHLHRGGPAPERPEGRRPWPR